MDFLTDFRRVLRSLAKARGFAVAVILTLALGIGANTAMFTLLRGTLLRPLPNRDGERLVYLRQSAQAAGQSNVGFSVPEITDFRAASKSLSGIAEYSSMTFTMLSGDVPVHMQAGIISGNYFEVMGLGTVLGRTTNARDDGPAAAPVGVLTHQFWMQHFGGDASVVGRVLRINDFPVTIIGVAQRAPHYPLRTDVFVNMVVSPHHLEATMVTGRTHRMTEVFGRLGGTSTVEQARAEVAGISRTMYADHPESYEKAAGYEISLNPLRVALNERASLTFWLLMGAATFVLLIACANVANLTLMRGVRREREMLVRAALGAGSWRLRALLLAENLTLALIGGALGVLVAFAGLKMLVPFAQQLTTRADEIRLDGVVLLVSLATSVAAAIALSLCPCDCWRAGTRARDVGPAHNGGSLGPTLAEHARGHAAGSVRRVADGSRAAHAYAEQPAVGRDRGEGGERTHARSADRERCDSDSRKAHALRAHEAAACYAARCCLGRPRLECAAA